MKIFMLTMLYSSDPVWEPVDLFKKNFSQPKIKLSTVEPPNEGHVGDNKTQLFVLHRQVVLI